MDSLGPGADYMYAMTAIGLFLMPWVMAGLGVLSGAGRTARSRAAGRLTALLLLIWFVASFVIAQWDTDQGYFLADVVGGGFCVLTWLLVPWLVSFLVTRWRRARRRSGGSPGAAA
ncbi:MULTISPECIES: hypothetical protein [unclassified Actinoplanes]|uniref:hypothetical protein n=1 Tax=unclassified Actinoplanes TaxID=2626549 RepID=UPI0005BB545D|nr:MULTISPECIES: hypothetical protein [unclassified Actinoplanes]